MALNVATESIKECCGTCKLWVFSKNPSVPEPRAEDCGECHRYPPVILQREQSQRWPRTRRDAYCYEWIVMVTSPINTGGGPVTAKPPGK